jgi:hypothetical protein
MDARVTGAFTRVFDALTKPAHDVKRGVQFDRNSLFG